MKNLINHFDRALNWAKSQNLPEPQTVKKFIEAIKILNPIPISGGEVNIRCEFIHQRPYAIFCSPPLINDVSRTELGDLLLVIKQIHRGCIKRKRCIVFQIKKTSTNWIKLTPHQHLFQRDFYHIAFRFGRNYIQNFKQFPLVWSHVTHSKWFLSNLFLFQNYNCVACAPDINSSLESFKLNSNQCHSKIGILFKDFLADFFSFRRVGHSLKGQVKGIVEVIYKRFGWQLDPEDEWLEYFGKTPGNESDDEGFGIIECLFEFD